MIFDDSEFIQVADISHHQGHPPRFPIVDFHKMKQWGFAGCVIRASHGALADNAFAYNWAACRGVLPRSSYSYYENLIEPKRQAEKHWSQIEDDFEGMAFLDLEDETTAKYYHWDYWYQWLERFKVLSGLPSDKIGIYSGYWYLKDNFKLMNAAQREYFRQYRLWLAWYGPKGTDPLKPDFESMLVPLPYAHEDLLMVQTGTPVIGRAAGVYSEELDYNRMNGRINFERMFGHYQPKADISISIRSAS